MTNGREYLQRTFNAFSDNASAFSEYSRSVDRQLGRLDIPQAALLFSQKHDTPPCVRITLPTSLGENCTQALPVTLRVLPILVIPSRTEYMPPWKLCRKQGQNVRVQSSSKISGEPSNNEWATGSGYDPEVKCGTHRIPDTRTDESSFKHTSIPSNRRSVAASRSPFSNRPKVHPKQGELGLEYHKPLCEKCRVNEQYWSASWCAECIWRFVRE